MIDSETFERVIDMQTDSFNGICTGIIDQALSIKDPVLIAETKRLLLELMILFQASREWAHLAGAENNSIPDWEDYLKSVEDSITSVILRALDRHNP